MVSEYGANAGVSGSLSVSGSVTFKGESDVNVDSNTLFVDASTNRVGVGTSSPISALDIAGKIAITSEASTPSQPSDGQGYLYAKSDGKIYWRSYDVSETDLTAGGGSGISHDGSTADGVLTYKDSDEATVESNLTFDGNTLTVSGDLNGSYVAIIDNDQSSNGHGLKVTSDGTGTGTNILDVESATTTHFRVRGDGRIGMGKVTALPAARLTLEGGGSDVALSIDEYIQHTGDANTTIRFTDDQITLEAGGSEELKITSDAVLVKQSIKHDGDEDTFIKFADDTITLKANNRSMIKASASAGQVLINNGGHDLDLIVRASGTGSLLCTDAGNARVGIGTDAPDYTLDVAGDIGIDQYIYHNGDADTWMRFTDDQITFKAGNLSFINVEKKNSAPHEVTINDGSNNIDFVVKGNGSNQGNPGMKFDASTNKLGINGVGTPSWELDVAGDIGLAEYIYHRTDIDTFIRFQDDSINLQAGGVDFITLTETSQDEAVINEAGADIDFRVEGDSDTHLLFVEGGTDRVGISTDDPDEKLHVSGNLKVVGDDPRIKIDGNVDSHPGMEIYENGTRKWIIYNNYANDDLTFKTNSNVRMTIAQDGVVGFTEGFEVGSDAAGDILYHNGTSYVRLAKGTADQVLTMNDAATAPNWEDASSGGSSNEYYHLTLSGRVRNTNGNLVGHAAYPYNAGDADWTTSLSSYVSNWTSGDTTFDATYANAMLYFTIGVAPAAMSLTSARIAYYMANDNMTDDYIWEVWKATPTSGTGYSTSLTWTRVGYIDRGGDPASQTFYAATGSISGSNSLAAGDLIGLTVHNPGDTYTNKYHGYHLVLRFTYS